MLFSTNSLYLNVPACEICAFRHLQLQPDLMVFYRTARFLYIWNAQSLEHESCVIHRTNTHTRAPFCWKCFRASASSKRWHFKIVVWRGSCVYGLVLLFPIICLMFPCSFVPLCVQPEIFHRLTATIKKREKEKQERGYCLFLILTCLSHPLFLFFFLSSLYIITSLHSSAITFYLKKVAHGFT